MAVALYLRTCRIVYVSKDYIVGKPIVNDIFSKCSVYNIYTDSVPVEQCHAAVPVLIFCLWGSFVWAVGFYVDDIAYIMYLNKYYLKMVLMFNWFVLFIHKDLKLRSVASVNKT